MTNNIVQGMYSKHSCDICKGKLNTMFAFSGLDSKTPVYDYRPYTHENIYNSASRIAQGSYAQHKHKKQQTPIAQKIHNLHQLFRFSGIQAGQWITKVHVDSK